MFIGILQVDKTCETTKKDGWPNLLCQVWKTEELHVLEVQTSRGKQLEFVTRAGCDFEATFIEESFETSATRANFFENWSGKLCKPFSFSLLL